ETLSIDLYAVVPLCGEPHATPVWLGVMYHDTIDNDLSDKAKEAAYRDFAKRSEKEFDAENTAYTYLERLGRSAARNAYAKALTDAHLHVSHPVFLVPHRDAFANRGDTRLILVGVAFVAVALLWLFLILVTPLRPPPDVIEAPEQHPMLHVLVPTREHWG